MVQNIPKKFIVDNYKSCNQNILKKCHLILASTLYHYLSMNNKMNSNKTEAAP